MQKEVKIGDKVTHLFAADQSAHIVSQTKSPFGDYEPTLMMVCGMLMMTRYHVEKKDGDEECQFCKDGKIDPGMLSVALAEVLGLDLKTGEKIKK